MSSSLDNSVIRMGDKQKHMNILLKTEVCDFPNTKQKQIS